MVTTSVDTNIFLDITSGELAAKRAATSALDVSAEAGPIVISTVCYAELAVSFPSASTLDDFLFLLKVRTTPLDKPTAFLAGQWMLAYKLRGGTRTRILADFLIAAHAQLHSDRLLTRDNRFFTDVFPNLKAVAPDDL
jgi:predicted nucleic acid-binding protein